MADFDSLSVLFPSVGVKVGSASIEEFQRKDITQGIRRSVRQFLH